MEYSNKMTLHDISAVPIDQGLEVDGNSYRDPQLYSVKRMRSFELLGTE